MPPVAKQGWGCICAVVLCALLGSQPGTLIARDQNFQSVTNMSDLETLVNEPWTNLFCIMPPGNFAYHTDLGVLTYLAGFSPEFLSSLSPETNSGIEMFHVSVWETNTTPRQRFYLNAAGLAACTTTVTLSGYPSNSIVASYGAVPAYLTGTDVNQWLDDRDPIRQRVLFTLISQSNSEAYYTAMTNALTVTIDGTNTFSLLDVYSNDIAFVKTATREDGLFEYYLHAPTNILQLDMYVSTNLLDNLGGWSLPVKLTHNSDPLHGLQIGTNSPTFFTIGNPALDSDGDGLSDGLEKWIFGTNPNLSDSDGDGLSDGEEIYRWGTNPSNQDSDGDLFSDGWEIANGYNPNSVQAWNFKEGKCIITYPLGTWDWAHYSNKITKQCPIGNLSTGVTQPIKGVVWSDIITNVLLVVGNENGQALRRYNAPVQNRQFSYDVPLVPGHNQIRGYAGFESSDVFYYFGTDKIMVELTVDAAPSNTLRMEFESTITPTNTTCPIFDVMIQRRVHSMFSTMNSWTVQRVGLNEYPTASWAYPYGTWNGSTRGVDITQISGMYRVDVHDVSGDHGTHNNTLRVLMNGSAVYEEIMTGVSNYITNDWRPFDTAMKGGVWVYQCGSTPGGFSVGGDKNIQLVLPQMTNVGYHYQSPIGGYSYAELGRISNGLYATSTEYPTSWYGMTNMTFTGPNGTSPVYLKYGESAQFRATGTLMLNTPGSGVTTNFPGLNIVDCFTGADELGVFNGKTPGHSTITCSGSSTTIDVYVAASPVAVNVQAAMDGNQDRVIDFANTNDSRCLFWINDDHDTIHLEGSKYVEDDTDLWSSGAPGRNCDDNTIGARGNQGGNPPSPQNNNCRRDLEDFTVLQIKVPATVTNLTGVTYWLKIVPESGTPVINVFRAVTNGVTAPFDYLTKTNVADLQIKETKLYEIGATEQQLNTSDVTPGKTLSYLVEGKSAGKGDLIFVLKNNGAEWTSDRIKLDLRTITNFYDIYQCWNINPTNKVKWEAEVSATSVKVQTNTAYTADASKYLLFVHGWNMAPNEKRWFAETAFKRLWWQGYKGGFGLYDWPTLWGCNMSAMISGPNKILHHYDDSEMIAWLSATALARLMEDLNTTGQLRVLAHSMGNVTMGEALRKYQGAQKIYSYTATQAAISGSVYDKNTPAADFSPILWASFGPETPNLNAYWFSGDASSTNIPYLIGSTSKVTRLCNYYNEVDYALRWWELNNKMKPDDAYGYRFAYGGTNAFYDETLPATNRFYRNVDPLESLEVGTTNLQSRYAIFAYDAESRSRALGRSTEPVFSRTNVDLHAVFFYDDTHYSHSKEFRSNINEQWGYYGAVIRDSSL